MMDELVSRSKVEFELCGGNLPEKYKAFVRRVLNDKSLVPAVYSERVVHGEWLVTDAYPHRLYCSVCYQTALPNVEYLERWGMTFEACPHCRAVMDGGDANGR